MMNLYKQLIEIDFEILFSIFLFFYFYFYLFLDITYKILISNR